MSETNGIAWSRLAEFIIVALFATAVAIWGQPFVHGNEEARGVIVNVFAILAGFLITVMTLLGEPSFFRGRTWRADEVKRSNVYRRLVRHKWLFVVYLLILVLVFLTTITAKRAPESRLTVFLETGYLFSALIAFYYSLLLPGRLLAIQLARFDELVESRKNSNRSANNSANNDSASK